MTTGEDRAKKLYSLAYNRASAILRERHREEFEKLLREVQIELIAEEMRTGEVARWVQPGGRGVVKHKAGEDGNCEWCGKRSPCPQEKERIRRQNQKAREEWS